MRRKKRFALFIGPALRLVWESAPGWTAANVLLVVVQGALPLVSLYLMKLVVDAVESGLAAPGADKGDTFARAALFIALTGVVSLLSALFGSLARIVSETQSQVVTDHTTAILHEKSVAVDLAYYESAQYHDTLHRAQREGSHRPLRIVNSLVQFGQSGVSLAVMAGLLLSLHWGVALVLLITAFPGVLVRLRYARKMYRWQRKRTAAERMSSYFNLMLTNITHAKEIRLFDLGPLFIRRYRELRRELCQEKLSIATQRSIAELVAQIGSTLAIFGSYIFIAYRTVQGDITLGDLVMYYQAFQRGQGFLRQTLVSLADLYENNMFLTNLYEFLNLESQVVDPLHPQPIPQPMQSGIALDHVNFQYPNGTRKVLEDITMNIRAGEHVALVGANGSGKTTLVKLLCRLYDPAAGSITVDGVDLRQFERAALVHEISVIFQDYVHYHLTARENIWFGNTELQSDDERIISAARLSGADGVIAGLPQGYDTILGTRFRGGEELSVGEWQKIALARAFLRDAQIIVLDEPTSALDAKAEYEVFEQFRQLAQGKTAILISHRFSTVKMADRIFVLEDGRIIESGDHDELMRRGGTYARMFDTQAQYYR